MKLQRSLALLALTLTNVLGILGCDGIAPEADTATVTVKEPGDVIVDAGTSSMNPSPESP